MHVGSLLQGQHINVAYHANAVYIDLSFTVADNAAEAATSSSHAPSRAIVVHLLALALAPTQTHSFSVFLSL